jgi:hypothetical protein
LLLAVCIGGTAVARDLANEDRTIAVRFSDGSVERYVVRYQAKLDSTIWEDGHPAEPLKGRFTDTRRCHWRANAAIEREACLTSRSGESFCRGQYSRILNTNVANQGAAGWSLRTGVHPENCGAARPRAQAEIDALERSTVASMRSVIDADQPVLQAEFRSKMSNVVDVREVR